MKRILTLALVVSLFPASLLLSPVEAKDPAESNAPATSASVIVLRRCLVDYEETTVLGAPSASILQDCLVRRGDRVKAGQVLGRLFDQDVRADMEFQAAKAANDTEIRLGKAEYDSAVLKFKKSQQLHERRFVSPEELGLERLNVERAQLAVEKAEHEQKLSQLEYRKAAAEVRSREFIAPHDGIVVEVNKHRGESVVVSDPIFRLVNIDRLKVIGSLNINDAWAAGAGAKVKIYPEIAGAELEVEREVFTGQVVFVGSEIDPETQTCRVVAEIDNRNGKLKSGVEARMEIFPSETADKAAAPGGEVKASRPVATIPVTGTQPK